MRQSRSDTSAFTRINFLTSPDSIFVGQSLYTLSSDTGTQKRIPITAGLTDLELAAENNVNPWTPAENNRLRGRWDLVTNDTLYLPSSDSTGEILPGITALSFTPAQQGQVTVALADGSADAGLTGSLYGYTLHFFPNADGKLEALQGIPRLAPPGPVDLILRSQDSAGNVFSIQQRVLVYEVNYGYDAPLQVADNFVDPAITNPEMDFLLKTVADAPRKNCGQAHFNIPSLSTIASLQYTAGCAHTTAAITLISTQGSIFAPVKRPPFTRQRMGSWCLPDRSRYAAMPPSFHTAGESTPATGTNPRST
jgi:hypothetical protein